MGVYPYLEELPLHWAWPLCCRLYPGTSIHECILLFAMGLAIEVQTARSYNIHASLASLTQDLIEKESSASQPVLFTTTPGADPTVELAEYANESIGKHRSVTQSE